MIIQRSKSKLITILVHILVWGVFGLAIFFYQPFLSGIDIPYQFWIKLIIVLTLLVMAFYFNSFILVPRFLLKNRTGYYFLSIVALVLAIVFLSGWVDKVLNMHQLFDIAFHKRNMAENADLLKHRHPPRKRGGVGDTLTLTICALVLGIS